MKSFHNWMSSYFNSVFFFTLYNINLQSLLLANPVYERSVPVKIDK